MPLRSTTFRRIGRLSLIKGGIEVPVAGGSTKFITWPALASLTGGTDKAAVDGTRFTCSLFVPHITIATGIGYLIGSVGGTDKAIAELHDANGVLIATSAVAGTTVGTAATMQNLDFTAPVEIMGPGWYFLSITMNGTTAKLRTLAAATAMASIALTKSATGTFGTVGDLTIPSTFTADVGPIAYIY